MYAKYEYQKQVPSLYKTSYTVYSTRWLLSARALQPCLYATVFSSLLMLCSLLMSAQEKKRMQIIILKKKRDEVGRLKVNEMIFMFI